jgi:DUF971 family protein
MPHDTEKWPTELRLNNEKSELSVTFDDGTVYAFTAEFLRVLSPSAEVQGHSPDQRKTVGGKKNVRIEKLEQMGNYAVKINFDDGHDTGLYSWSYLDELGQDQSARWTEYLEELAEKGLTRE